MPTGALRPPRSQWRPATPVESTVLRSNHHLEDAGYGAGSRWSASVCPRVVMKKLPPARNRGGRNSSCRHDSRPPCAVFRGCALRTTAGPHPTIVITAVAGPTVGDDPKHCQLSAPRGTMRLERPVSNSTGRARWFVPRVGGRCGSAVRAPNPLRGAVEHPDRVKPSAARAMIAVSLPSGAYAHSACLAVSNPKALP
jgi:hypothetical protein